MPDVDHLLSEAAILLTDGGLETRLIYEFGCDLPDFAAFLPLFRDDRAALETVYRSYFAIADEFRLPMQIGSPTWRAHPDSLKRLGFGNPGDLERVNGEAVAFVQELRAAYGLEDLVLIAGVIGPRGDGYDAAHAPREEEAARYHAAQANVLSSAGVDFLYAPTFASAEELSGVARAMAATGLPYCLAPVIDTQGRLLDGAPFADVAKRIDARVSPRPTHYLVGCVHPTRLREAERNSRSFAGLGDRLAGLKANASPLPPEELDRLKSLDEGSPEDFAREMVALHRDYGLRVLGGCCGTNDRHMRALAERLVAEGV